MFCANLEGLSGCRLDVHPLQSAPLVHDPLVLLDGLLDAVLVSLLKVKA